MYLIYCGNTPILAYASPLLTLKAKITMTQKFLLSRQDDLGMAQQ